MNFITMFWTTLLWTGLLWTWPWLSGFAYLGLFSYNWYSFETDSVRVKNIAGIEDLDRYSFTTYKTAREDGEWYVSRNVDRKKMVITGVLKADSVSELQIAMENMKQALFVPNQEARYRKSDGVMVQTTATCTWLTFNRKHRHLTYVPFTVTLETLKPFFYSSLQQTVSFLSQTVSFVNSVPNAVWNYKAQPIISVNFNTGLSSVTTITITLNGQIVSATGTFTDSDIVTFDCDRKDVALNSVWEQAYTGSFGDLPIWEANIEVSIDWTRDADIYVLRDWTYV